MARFRYEDEQLSLSASTRRRADDGHEVSAVTAGPDLSRESLGAVLNDRATSHVDDPADAAACNLADKPLDAPPIMAPSCARVLAASTSRSSAEDRGAQTIGRT